MILGCGIKRYLGGHGKLAIVEKDVLHRMCWNRHIDTDLPNA